MGRPLKFKTPAELEEKIEAYFESCLDYKRDLFGNRIVDKTSGEFVREIKTPPTVTGMALWLGTSRESLMNYEKREPYFDAVKDAKARIHMIWESRLWGSNPTGAIFNLKNNWGWRDQSEVKQSGDFKIEVVNYADDDDADAAQVPA